ncbi:MAG: hypothetical protein MJ033_08250 [Victivallaceae bacterium]|nr:hypothetical protein [Victivallaceae bacterium]
MKLFFVIKRWFLPLVLTALLISGMIFIQKQLLKTAQEEKLRFSDVSAQAIPGSSGENNRAAIRFVQKALGSFRGLAADFLWLRAERMKQEGRNFELTQLSSWIIDLQPNYASAVAYLGWNLAYNISVTTSDFAERWRWVQEGISLFKERALVYNPDDPEIYRELAWIYFHKMGDTMDDAQAYYKIQQARKIAAILGNAPDFAAMAQAPKGKTEFQRAFAAYKEKLWQDDRKFDAFYEDLYRKFTAQIPSELPGDLLADEPQLRRQIDAALRAEQLRRTEKLEPVKMDELNRKYGELDWRTAESQALYWASLGVDADPAKGLLCKRQLVDALAAAFQAGIIQLSEGNEVSFVPNFRLGEPTLKAMEQYEKDCMPTSPGFAEAARTKRINFLKNAVPLFYAYGLYRDAENYYRKLADLDDSFKNQNFEQYVFSVWKEEVRGNDVKRAGTIISGLISTAIQYLVRARQTEAVSYERMARYLHQYYMQQSGDNQRVKLPPYSEMKADITRFYLNHLPPAQAALLRQAVEIENLQKGNDIIKGNKKK